MQKLSKSISKICFLLWTGIAFSSISSDAALKIEERFFTDAEMFFLSDFNLQNLQDNPLMFMAAIRTNNPPTIVWLKFTLSTDRYGQLISARTDTFVLENERIVTNYDFDQSGSPNNPDIKLEDYDVNLGEADTFKKSFFGTGRVPSDVYRFTLRIEEYNNPDNFDILSKIIKVTNPTAVNLIAPGGEPPDEEITFRTHPQFQWESLANKFQLTICEKLPGDASPEEVMNKLPHYQTIVEYRTFHDYPTSAVRPLEPDHTYYWQVKALVPTSGGTVEFDSDIWGFTILGDIELNDLVLAIEALLGEDYRDILDMLLNYRPTGRIIFGTRTISIDELRSYFEDFRTGKSKMTKVEVE